MKRTGFICVFACIVVYYIFSICLADSNHTYTITFKNSSTESIYYYLYRIDHKLTHVKKPIAFVIGNLDPGQTWKVSREKGNYFYLEWRKSGEYRKSDEETIQTDPFHLEKDLVFTYEGEEKIKP